MSGTLLSYFSVIHTSLHTSGVLYLKNSVALSYYYYYYFFNEFGLELQGLFTGSLNVQYYLRTGTCKFASSCKFNHPKNAGGSLTNAPLNIYGYPLRPVIHLLYVYWHIYVCKDFHGHDSFLFNRERKSAPII